MYAVEIENVSKSFGRTKAVDELSVNVPQGSICGFLGPNGAGKTTTIRMIMNIITPDSGRIRIFGQNGGKFSKDRISYMPEERGLYKKMTVKGVLYYFGSLKSLSQKQLDEKVPYWLDRVALSGNGSKKVEELSRGMHQKLQFAVCVINEPDIVILDEPFSGLDPINLELLKNIMLEMREKGTTIIFSTHVMHEAERLCKKIVLINKGKVIIDGRIEDIKSKHSTGTVSVRIDGDISLVKNLPFVRAVEKNGSQFDIILNTGTDPQQLLQELVKMARVQSFEIKSPSLHEIFIRLVGADNEQNF